MRSVEYQLKLCSRGSDVALRARAIFPDSHTIHNALRLVSDKYKCIDGYDIPHTASSLPYLKRVFFNTSPTPPGGLKADAEYEDKKPASLARAQSKAHISYTP
ncbi:uncharacterized protein TM35_000132850 [Trypanosoma theileri]|uniref:Uncharacterized protein n=1 Tax=Trypanosoma theileri TaxID=67003 RepID=A0A1X0NXE9_9TRYP|nr:uncharacterized protein TM35_000132850 [Trypanosoma theileri]ORC89281.1 hypothetical protein TM35_000132850 [Trypanosoma theileri]